MAREPRISEARGEHERQAAVDSDRGGGVAGRIARVDRQMLQPDDAGRARWTIQVVTR